MNYNDVLQNARACIDTAKCKACPVCNGLACRNTIPGPGAKGVGDTAIRNYQKWQDIRILCTKINWLICRCSFLGVSSVILFLPAR